MVFSSLIFLLGFLPCFLLLYFLLRTQRQKNVFLLLASLAFYAWGEPKFVFLMIASIICNWRLALEIAIAGRSTAKAKNVMLADAAINLALLLVFKYLGFATANLQYLFPSIRVISIALPIGISFFTFQSLSYVIDVYRGDVEAETDPIHVGLYIAMFPQLIAGPIVRYKTIAKEIRDRKTTKGDVLFGVDRFVVGLSKKVILANNLAVAADAAFSRPSDELSVCMAWLGAICYSLQIYYDFSGYSDMAIGLGSMMGFHFEENFNRPYLAASVTDFWRRWHISLSSWFRDYVYIPLGGSRTGSETKNVRNLFIVWLLTGIWHGANWTFLAWGLIYFAVLVLEKYWIHPERITRGRAIWRVWTLLIVCCEWVIFRSDSIRAAASYLAAMFGAGQFVITHDPVLFYAREYAVILVCSVFMCLPFTACLPRLNDRTKKAEGRPNIYIYIPKCTAPFCIDFVSGRRRAQPVYIL